MSEKGGSGSGWWRDWVARDSGLQVRDARGEHYVPLVGVAIDVTARGTASTVTVAQRYVNREDVTVEAVYSHETQRTTIEEA